MIATLLRFQIAAELALYVGAGAWLLERGWSPAAVVACALVVLVGTRLAIVAIALGVSTVHATPRNAGHRLGPGRAAAILASETRAMLADNFWLLPFESVAVRPDPPPVRGGVLPVLAVHGYVSNRGMLAPLVRGLEAAGAPQVFTFNARGIFAPIEDVVAQLDARIAAVLEATAQERLVLVCHSMGGLAARAWLARHGARQVERVVTIASPHNGTALAALGLGRNARQMRRGSDFLRALAAAEGDRGPACPFTSIYTVHDTLVAPQDTSRLPWAKNVELAGRGHVGILAAKELHLLVAEELRQAGALAR